MTETQKNQLNTLIGQPKSFKGKNITITKFKEVSGTNVVIFKEEGAVLANLLNSEIDNFLLELSEPLPKELTLQQMAIPEQKLKIFEPTKENETVKEALLDTLKKVKSDPSYIPQAQAICEVVNQIVNVQKTEIQMLNILQKQKG